MPRRATGGSTGASIDHFWHETDFGQNATAIKRICSERAKTRTFYVSCLLLAGLMPSSLAAQTRFEAPGGVAAQTITNSPITFGLTPEQVKELTEAAARGATAPLTSTIVELSMRLGVTEDATKTLLRIVGEQEVPLDRLSEMLNRVANDYKRLQTQAAALNPDNPVARELVERSKIAITKGRLEDARQLLAQARQVQISAAQEARKLREKAQAAEDAQLLGAAASTATEGNVAMTERHYTEAAALFKQAATLVPNGHPDERRQYLANEAEALFLQGDERGDNEAASMAIDRYTALSVSVDRVAKPLDWAKAQNDLGNALYALGSRERGTTRLEEAVAAFKASLKERTRERVPLDWALTQNNLGFTLWKLGERESGTARLEEAAAVFHAALEVLSREREPLDWASTQTNLGAALWRLGERESGTARLEEALTAHRAALGVLTRERVPLEWASTQNNIGLALQRLGERESGTARLEEAVTAHRAALEERTRGRIPLEWATSQHNLGLALSTLGERESGTARLQEALIAYRAALEEQTRKRIPLEWALAQNNLGLALQRLGERETGTARLEEALTIHRAALEEQTRELVPLDWAKTQNNLGLALQRLGKRESGKARLEEAVATYRAALEERTRERVPLDWAATQNNLGLALEILGQREIGTAHLEEAVAAWELCLSVTVSAWPAAWVEEVRNLRDKTRTEIETRNSNINVSPPK